MSEVTIENGLDIKTVSAPLLPIRSVAPESLPPATPDPAGLYYRPFGNHGQTSRAPRPLPKGAWALQWKADLDPAFTPTFAMEGKDRILVQSGEWRLFDRAGKPIARNRAGAAPMTIDTHIGMFYYTDADSYLRACRLTTGEPFFKYLPAYGDAFTRIQIARYRTRMAVVGTERALDPHRVRNPERSLIEVNELGLPPKVDDLGFLTSLVPVGVMRIQNPQMVAASSDTMIAGATQGALYIVDWNVQLKAVLESALTPQSLSIDEAQRIYLLGSAGATVSLWLLKADGSRLYAFDLPPNSELPNTPPIVGYDHTAYLLSGHRIFAVGSSGKQLWTATAPRKPAGAVVTPNGLLIVTEGSEVVAYDAKGARTVLFHGDAFLTPPLPTAAGELVVASKTAVFSYSAH